MELMIVTKQRCVLTDITPTTPSATAGDGALDISKLSAPKVHFTLTASVYFPTATDSMGGKLPRDS